MSNEAETRLITNELLKESEWILFGKDKNVLVENKTRKTDGNIGSTDYTLLDDKGKPLVVLEAKQRKKDPLIGKEQSRNYSKSLGNRYVILSNSIMYYLWDLEGDNPKKIYRFSTQKEFLREEFDNGLHMESIYLCAERFPK